MSPTTLPRLVDPAIRVLVRSRFALTSRRAATAQIERSLARYLDLAASTDVARGSSPVRVPPMPGIDPEMRAWSFFQILEHNAIVNRAIADVVQSLARGSELAGPGAIDPKHDVLPAAAVGPEAVDSFRQSVENYLAMLPSLGSLRSDRTRPHPVFGTFDAHRWHCMFGFHLGLHERQARYVLRRATAMGARREERA